MSCQCFESFSGPRCETNLCDNVQCLNGGYCKVDETEGFELTCDCKNGFIGDNCQIDICSDFECSNSGNCTVDDSDSDNLKPKCVCEDEFTGDNCDIPLICVTGDPCQNDGVCQFLPGSNPSDQGCSTQKRISQEFTQR